MANNLIKRFDENGKENIGYKNTIEAVIYLLNNVIELDGETMEYIIQQAQMTDQMKKQLAPEASCKEEILNELKKQHI